MNHAMNSTIQAMMNFLFMVSPSRCTAANKGRRSLLCGTSVGPSIRGALLPDWRLTDWRHQVLIGGTRPHHVRALAVWNRALGVGVVDSGIGANDHDVWPGLDPVVGSSRLCRVRVGVAGVGAPG